MFFYKKYFIEFEFIFLILIDIKLYFMKFNLIYFLIEYFLIM